MAESRCVMTNDLEGRENKVRVRHTINGVVVRLHGYEGLVKPNGGLGIFPSGCIGNGFLPDARQLRLYAEFIEALADEMDKAIETWQKAKGE
jgi:hypothetical protein